MVTASTSGSGELRLRDGDELFGSLIPELFLQLFRKAHVGRVRFSGADLEPALVEFQAGIPVKVSLPHHAELYSSVLGELLPGEQLALVKGHALRQGSDPISAAVNLSLLPAAHEPRVRRSFLTAVVGRLTSSPAPICVNVGGLDGAEASEGQPGSRAERGAVRSGSDQGDGPADEAVALAGLLSVVAGALFRATDISFYKRRLASTWVDPLVVRSDVELHGLLEGTLRHVLVYLRRRSESIAMLLVRRVAPEHELVAIVYALRAVGAIRSSSSLRSGTAVRAGSLGTDPPSAALGPSPAPVRRAAPSSGARGLEERGAPSEGPGGEREASGGHARRRPVREIDLTQTQSGSNLPAARRELSAASQASSEGSTARMKRAPTPAAGVPRTLLKPQSERAGDASVGSGTHRLSTRPTLSVEARRSESAGPAVSPAEEHRIEAAALEAWMRSVDEPSYQGKALLLAEMAAQRYPANPRILFYLGCAYAQSHREPEAEVVLARVLRLDPDHDEAARELGSVRRRLTGRSQQRSKVSTKDVDKKRAR